MTKKAENKKETPAAKKRNTVWAENFSSELDEPIWSVVSFEKCAAKNLTYAHASEKLKQLEAKKVSGLCIVTDEAARRVGNSK